MSTWSSALPTGEDLLARAAVLMDIPRALNGPAVHRTLDALSEWVPGLTKVDVPTGTSVLDWTVPDEWDLRRAVLRDPEGQILADTDDSLLHVVSHSEPVDVHLDLDQLQPHLHSLPDRPQSIPWRSSYYARNWGFCLADEVRRELRPGRYHAVVDSTLGPGHLTYAEALLPGDTGQEILLSSHICHPAMANDNVSGNVIAAAVAQIMAARPRRRYSYRFLFGPGTIGAIAWLAANSEAALRVRGGLVLSGVADPGIRLTYKRSRRDDAVVDRAMTVALRDSGVAHDIVPYLPWGYDERQFNTLGFDLGVGLLNRTPHGTYPQYHTSADDLGFIRADHLRQSLEVVMAAIEVLERDDTHRNLRPHGEPQLGRRGLYPSTGGQQVKAEHLAMLWVLSESDGATSVCDIAIRSGTPFSTLADAADRLLTTDLLGSVHEETTSSIDPGGDQRQDVSS